MRLNNILSILEKLKQQLHKKPRINVDYAFVFENHQKTDVATIKLLKGKYAGVIYGYSKVDIPDKENEDGSLNMSFDYAIYDKNGLEDFDFLGNKKFQKIVGDILTSMLIETAITTSMEDLKNEEAGDDYTEEPDTRRRVRKKSSTVSE